MVLWEITVTTAYFLGLKRTYRLALRLQRRLVSPKHPKIRQFLHRRTRSVFDVAVKVHKNVQQRDLEVGRNLGNWILRWLDRMKPSAQIRPHKSLPDPHGNPLKNVTSSSRPPEMESFVIKAKEQESSGRLNFTPLNIREKPFPMIAMMIQSRRSVNMCGQHHLISHDTTCASALDHKRSLVGGVLRKDIADWIHHN